MKEQRKVSKIQNIDFKNVLKNIPHLSDLGVHLRALAKRSWFQALTSNNQSSPVDCSSIDLWANQPELHEKQQHAKQCPSSPNN